MSVCEEYIYALIPLNNFFLKKGKKYVNMNENIHV